MQRTRQTRQTRRLGTTTAVIAVLAAAMFLFAGVAGAAAKTATEIDTAKDAQLGTILVAGNTVYTLKGKHCSGACLKTWTPVVLPDGTTEATAGSGVDDSKLGTKELSNGSRQVTYDGAPLYWYAKDKKAGSVKGNTTDKFGKWSVVVAKEATSSTAGTGGAAF